MLRQLRFEFPSQAFDPEAQLTQPARIDGMARGLGLAEPQPGQVIHPTAHPDGNAPALAQVAPLTPAMQ